MLCKMLKTLNKNETKIDFMTVVCSYTIRRVIVFEIKEKE